MNPQKEAARLRGLMDYRVLDTEPEQAFDRLTELAALLFDAPIAIVSLIDAERQWFKSRVGFEPTETPRELAFCAHAIELDNRAVMVVEDASSDARFANNPLVTGAPNIRFYAGAVLSTADGHNLGTLCVMDDKPRPTPYATDLKRLAALAEIVVDEMDLRRARRDAEEKKRQLELAEHMAALGNWRLDLVSGVMTWSDELYRIHGVSRETFTPSLGAAMSLYPPEDQAKIRRGLDRGLAGEPSLGIELRLRRPDGEWRDVACKAVPEFDHLGEVAALIGVYQDMTERREQERALTASDARYRLITENASAEAADLVPGRGAVPASGLRLLVVDDHAANRQLVRVSLAALGVEVTGVDNGAAAVEVGGTQPFDVILMALNMPGMSGAAACGEIRRGGGPNDATPILAFSAVGESEADMDGLEAAGFDGLVCKPVEPAALIAAVVRATNFSRPPTARPTENQRQAG